MRARLGLIVALLGGLSAVARAQTPASGSPEWPRDAEGNYLVTFRFSPPASCERVYLAGDFNDWNPRGAEMSDEDGDGSYEVTAPLVAGRHVYKFTLDGERWFADPGNPNVDRSGFGNSILYLAVDPGDFPEDRGAPPPPPRWRIWLPTAMQTRPTPRGTGDHATLFHIADDGYDAVSVAGDFNRWTGQLDQLTRSGARGEWQLSLDLRESPWFTYRFVATRAGETFSMRDPANPDITFDGHPMDSVGNTLPRRSRGRMSSVGDPDRPPPGHGVVQIMEESLAASASSLEARPIYVWLPPGFGEDPEMRYPVLYMHDGQNVFDDPVNPFGHGGWHVNTTAEELMRHGRIESLLIVAVPNSPARMEEYGLGADVLDSGDRPYARYLIDDVMPRVNARYPTLTGPANTAVMGSSMGGLVSLLLAYNHPDVFGAAACLSSAFVIKDGRGQTLEALIRAGGKRPIRIYLDSGNAGDRRDGAAGTRAMRDLLVATGWELGQDLVWHEEDGAEHSERAWRARLWRPLELLFGQD